MYIYIRTYIYIYNIFYWTNFDRGLHINSVDSKNDMRIKITIQKIESTVDIVEYY